MVHSATVQRRLAAGWTLDAAQSTPSLNVPTDLTGLVFGRLTVIEFAGHKAVGATRHFVQWQCRCACGGSCVVTANNLRGGVTKSCGCLAKETTAKMSTTHGHSRRGAMSREYNAWRAMKNRCFLETCAQYPSYGGRGITVCDRWERSFEAFYADMGPCPAKHEIDRVDNNGSYTPDNCRWATRLEQMRNVRCNALRGIDDEHLSWSQVADHLAMPWWTLRRYLLASTH